ncbi:MAG: hypothetical protein AAF492_26330 [Verrucomicrobiota bacterium]
MKTADFSNDLERVETLLTVADFSALDCVISAYDRCRYINNGASDLPYIRRLMDIVEDDPSLPQLDHIKLAMLWCNLEDWDRLLEFFLPRFEQRPGIAPHVRAGMAIALYKTNRPEEATQHIKAVRAHQRHQGFQRGKDFRIFMDAELAAHEAEGKPITDPDLMHWKARLQYHAMQWEEADRTMQEFINITPEPRMTYSTRWFLARPGRITAPTETLHADDWRFSGMGSRHTVTISPDSESRGFIVRRMWSPKARSGYLVHASRHPYTIHLNGELMVESEGQLPDGAPGGLEQNVTCTLRPGWNTLFIGVTHGKRYAKVQCNIIFEAEGL